MAGLVPAIHVLGLVNEIVDARHEAGHDESVARVASALAEARAEGVRLGEAPRRQTTCLSALAPPILQLG